MLTRPQIQRLAQRNRIGMQAQERDYIQHILLFSLYSQSQALIFKGGTALRIIYQGNRYSEDLDFNGPDDVPALQDLWEQVSKPIALFWCGQRNPQPMGVRRGLQFRCQLSRAALRR